MRVQIVDVNMVGEGVLPAHVCPCQKLPWLGLKLRLDPHFIDDSRSTDYYIVNRAEALSALQRVDREVARRWKLHLEMMNPLDWLVCLRRESCKPIRTLTIRILSDPSAGDGPACRIPLWVREAWIGCHLEPEDDELQPRKWELIHIGTEKQGPSTLIIFPSLPPDERGRIQQLTIPGEITVERAESRVGYSVNSHEALLALSKHNKAAFRWWVDNHIEYWASWTRNFIFSVDCCEVIERDEEDCDSGE